MQLRAFNHTVSIITLIKNEKMYGMTCAWCTQVGYHEIVCLLGDQSITGRMISKGDTIGISALAKGQKELAFLFGEHHSDEIDKFSNCEYLIKDGVVLIKNAKVQMQGKVMDILHLEGIESDNLLYVKVLTSFDDPTQSFLTLEDIDES